MPKYLYKILTVENWKASQGCKTIQLSADDQPFIHLSQEEQLDRIIEKYWSGAPVFIVLKLDIEKLQGRMVFESNPGGSNKYYHLYDGSIPIEAVVESKNVVKL